MCSCSLKYLLGGDDAGGTRLLQRRHDAMLLQTRDTQALDQCRDAIGRPPPLAIGLSFQGCVEEALGELGGRGLDGGQQRHHAQGHGALHRLRRRAQRVHQAVRDGQDLLRGGRTKGGVS